MNLNSTPNSNRYTIGLFGQINAGKSSLINALTGEEIAITSPSPGTTTDPVTKAMELLPIGPILLIDTPGIDDFGELGRKRVSFAYKALKRCDIVLLVIDASLQPDINKYAELISKINDERIPVIIVYNKCDLGITVDDSSDRAIKNLTSIIDRYIPRNSNVDSQIPVIMTDAISGKGIPELKNALINEWRRLSGEKSSKLLNGLVDSGDVILLVTPIDEGAPKGRLILPQQQVIREILDVGATCLVTKNTEIKQALANLAGLPDLVITDSQVFSEVNASIPSEVPLTSFSIIFAKAKGDLHKYVDGISTLKSLRPSDRVLISESCTHHVQCNDIGRFKIPKVLSKLCEGLELNWSSGKDFPENLSSYKLIVHCGACMLNRQEMQRRIRAADEESVHITNYGMLLAFSSGILPRALMPFGLNFD